ncbi:multiple monosaccharide ABC transporter membrane protein [Anaerobacterium chartisolvens]|uniref:Xylose transport system permease protein XylH n=1 Tax=Anaerobacterium chartisolvens TaxID=1297424 RepID=A0A369B5S7_9FIRM|nr:multiple monosaccharide ABC transporter permease [Anaerobacterium chartisolvens]RCX16872.1 multiple monosaccharide ABC transporter membrane protein [Anaerobacterium chartisolvens]
MPTIERKVVSLEKKAFSLDIKKYAMFIALIVIVLFFQVTTDKILLVPMNVSKLVMQNSYILILTIGMLPCILTGNIDLSVGSIVAVIGAVSGTMIISMHQPVWLAVCVCLLLGIAIGAWQGLWIAFVRVPSFIVTLAGMLIFRGLTMVILDGNTLGPYPASYQFVAQAFLPDIPGTEGHITTMLMAILLAAGFVFLEFRKRKQQIKYGIQVGGKIAFSFRLAAMAIIILFVSYWLTLFRGMPIILVLLGVLIIFYSFVTTKTVIGRHIYALGGNERATELSGVKTKWVKFAAYVNMGLMAAVAGLVFSARLNCAGPTAGNGFELDAIAACYIGGASATGGVGTVVGAIVGGLVMGVLNNGMSIMGIGIDWQQAIKGFVLLVAVAFDIYNQSKK